MRKNLYFRIVNIVITTFCIVGILFLATFAPLAADDFVGLGNLAKLGKINYIYDLYKFWSSSLTTCLICALGWQSPFSITLWGWLNGICVITLFYLSLSLVSQHWLNPMKDITFLAIGSCILWFIIPVRGQVFFWRSGAAPYLWSIVLAVMLLSWIILGTEKKRIFAWQLILLFMLSFFVGSSYPQTAAGMLVALSIFVIGQYFTASRVREKYVCALIGVLGGFCVQILSPGILSRMNVGGVVRHDFFYKSIIWFFYYIPRLFSIQPLFIFLVILGFHCEWMLIRKTLLLENVKLKNMFLKIISNPINIFLWWGITSCIMMLFLAFFVADRTILNVIFPLGVWSLKQINTKFCCFEIFKNNIWGSILSLIMLTALGGDISAGIIDQVMINSVSFEQISKIELEKRQGKTHISLPTYGLLLKSQNICDNLLSGNKNFWANKAFAQCWGLESVDIDPRLFWSSIDGKQRLKRTYQIFKTPWQYMKFVINKEFSVEVLKSASDNKSSKTLRLTSLLYNNFKNKSCDYDKFYNLN